MWPEFDLASMQQMLTFEQRLEYNQKVYRFFRKCMKENKEKAGQSVASSEAPTPRTRESEAQSSRGTREVVRGECSGHLGGPGSNSELTVERVLGRNFTEEMEAALSRPPIPMVEPMEEDEPNLVPFAVPEAIPERKKSDSNAHRDVSIPIKPWDRPKSEPGSEPRMTRPQAPGCSCGRPFPTKIFIKLKDGFFSCFRPSLFSSCSY